MYHVGQENDGNPLQEGSSGDSETSIIRIGENAWRRETADKIAFMIDGKAYFETLDRALRLASRRIWIIGWDFSPDIRLTPEDPESPTLGNLLLSLVEAKPALEIHILVWAMGPIYSGKSLKLFRKKGWASHPRIHLNFDTHHPLRGSHHQKIVCIDDTTGFIGGIDLTARRWDDSDHRPGHPLRVTPDGEAYEPVHDMQAAVSGPAARMLGDVCRERWFYAMDETIVPVDGAETAWPETLAPALTGCPVAIARTTPATIGNEGIHESIHMLTDALTSAQHVVYIEAQYLAAFGIADILIERLARPDGPEVLIVVTRISHGFIEKVIMGTNRDRLIRRLKRNDPYDRLRVMYAVVPSDDEDGQQEVLVHSKLVIIDDRFLRLGSSNLNNRSEGMDTEADMAIEAVSEEQRAAIADIRYRLLAEHLDSTPDAVRDTIARLNSLHDGVEALNTGRRGLRHFDIDLTEGEEDPLPGTDLVDPAGPIHPIDTLRRGASAIASRIFGSAT
ncbi:MULTISPECIES: phospholipase D-like domain-containing protein [unclassified Rhizobium]|uniref:phospholipase D-like domain-containing protein n=1 Tax=unclassified Rhizobium TaxID=2613769 RepID=UPI0012E3F881|nr:MULTISPECIES: phospholipase D-like domain-containing protein [unclassified Rhizobium]